jgi:hypothetical protein
MALIAGVGARGRAALSRSNFYGGSLAVMFIGIIVLCTFGAAALACAVLAIRGAMRRNWAVFGALMIPAIGIGGTIIMMVGPVIMVELFGDPNLEDVPESAQKLDDGAIQKLYANQEQFGLAYKEDGGTFYWYDQSVDEGGGFKGVAQDNSTFAGGWEVVEGQICYNISNTLSCYDVYNLGDEYAEVNHRDEIVSRFRLLPAPMLSPEGGVALSQATVNAIVPGHTLSGMLQLYYDDPQFTAVFAADGDGVTVTRGGTERTGTYSIDENGRLCLMGVLYLDSDCLVIYPSPNGFDLVRSNGRVTMTVTTLE